MTADASEKIVSLPMAGNSLAKSATTARETTTERGAAGSRGHMHDGSDGGAPSLPRRLVQRVRLARQLLSYHLLCFLLSHHLPLKLAFALLRRRRPIAVVGKSVIVTKADDVREVLYRFDDFTLDEILGEGMPWGPFMITLDWRVQHALERQLMQSAVDPPTDIERIRRLAAHHCRNKIRDASEADTERGQIDVVADLANPIAVAIVTTYFGVPPINGNRSQLGNMVDDLASFIMAKPPKGSRRRMEIRNSIVALTTHIDSLIQTRAQACAAAAGLTRPRPDDLLGRLVHRLCGNGALPAWFDQAWIRRYITGLVGTGGATFVRATTQAVDRLIAHPSALRLARALVARLDEAEREARILAAREAPADEREAARLRVEAARARFRQVVYEALRFRPMLPLLVRYSPRETIIAKGTTHARMVPAGASVYAPPLAAMFDPRVVEVPWRFCSSRPIEDFLHFGHGERACFGKYVADTAMLEVVRALVRLPDLRRAGWPGGRVRYHGPVARSLALTFCKAA